MEWLCSQPHRVEVKFAASWQIRQLGGCCVWQTRLPVLSVLQLNLLHGLPAKMKSAPVRPHVRQPWTPGTASPFHVDVIVEQGGRSHSPYWLALHVLPSLPQEGSHHKELKYYLYIYFPATLPPVHPMDPVLDPPWFWGYTSAHIYARSIYNTSITSIDTCEFVDTYGDRTQTSIAAFSALNYLLQNSDI